MDIFNISDRDKLIFEYVDSDGTVARADPMVLERRLNRASRASSQDFWDAQRQMHEGSRKIYEADLAGEPVEPLLIKSRDEAAEVVVAVIHEAFDTVPLQKSGHGLPDSVAIANFNRYLDWCGAKKNSTETPPESSSPADGPQGAS